MAVGRVIWSKSGAGHAPLAVKFNIRTNVFYDCLEVVVPHQQNSG